MCQEGQAKLIIDRVADELVLGAGGLTDRSGLVRVCQALRLLRRYFVDVAQCRSQATKFCINGSLVPGSRVGIDGAARQILAGGVKRSRALDEIGSPRGVRRRDLIRKLKVRGDRLAAQLFAKRLEPVVVLAAGHL